MSDKGFYNSREQYIPKADISGRNPKESLNSTARRNRIRRTKNSGLRRLFHLARKESGGKVLIGSVLLLTFLLLLFSWIYSF
tara:strand:+ start:1091 stop:1336 length:246 start_codon:yes stop_codon:yes gene_type:complete